MHIFFCIFRAVCKSSEGDEIFEEMTEENELPQGNLMEILKKNSFLTVFPLMSCVSLLFLISGLFSKY